MTLWSDVVPRLHPRSTIFHPRPADLFFTFLPLTIVALQTIRFHFPETYWTEGKCLSTCPIGLFKRNHICGLFLLEADRAPADKQFRLLSFPSSVRSAMYLLLHYTCPKGLSAQLEPSAVLNFE